MVAHSGGRLLSHVGSHDIDVVVTDILLLDMNASDLLDSLNTVIDRTFRSIVRSYEADAVELRRRGVDVSLPRPVSRNELLRAVHVAMEKRSSAGLNVLLVDSGDIDGPRLERLMTDAGHITMIVDDTKEAAAIVRTYASDVVIVSANSLSSTWHELKGFGGESLRATRVVVLCGAVRKREKRFEEMYNVQTLVYRIGYEEDVVDALLSSQNDLVKESLG